MNLKDLPKLQTQTRYLYIPEQRKIYQDFPDFQLAPPQILDAIKIPTMTIPKEESAKTR